MTISLVKGQKLSLSKEAPGIKLLRIGLGWDARSTDGAPFDLDSSAILVAATGKVRSDEDFVFYGQLSDVAGSVVHQGDNLTGDGDGDDEQIVIDLTKVPADIERIVITASIYEGTERNQTFGQVRNAYVRVVNEDDGAEVTRYDLSEDYDRETALVFAEVYRNNADWKVNAVGQGYADGLGGIARDFGVKI
jgi:tellurium resistance protein TerD